MRCLVRIATCIALAGAATALPAAARSGAELPAYIQCAPYAREVSGIQLFGAARDWWDQAQGKYATGNRPREGAVMAFPAQRSMTSGHVATVAKVLDDRRVLLDHANWSPIDGRRGQVERGVLAIDVSPAGDWSQVRVWYAPLQDVGTSVWAVSGFIYAARDRRAAAPQLAVAARPAQPSKDFAQAFAKFE